MLNSLLTVNCINTDVKKILMHLGNAKEESHGIRLSIMKDIKDFVYLWMITFKLKSWKK